jgi:hypothetical protein
VSGIPYRFLPAVRRGLARSYAEPDGNESGRPVRPKVSVGLTLQARQNGTDVGPVSGNVDLYLYGPGDIQGIDPRLIVRTEPKAGATNFEPNYLAAVDFDPPDFPWMMTPAKSNAEHNLRPWIALVVIEWKLANLAVLPGRPLPSISLQEKAVKTELPDLQDSWSWAHAQAVSTASDTAAIARELLDAPARNVSRLICPRHLNPNTAYVACVVPAFAAGRERGLGQNVTAKNLEPAWNVAPPDPGGCELPVYFHWRFSTGPLGDVESLARRLRTPEKYRDNEEILAQLNHIGELPVLVDADRLLVEEKGKAKKPRSGVHAPLPETTFEGALLSLAFEPNPDDSQFRETKKMFAKHLETILNSGQEQAITGQGKKGSVPTLSPPIYGEHPAKRHVVNAKDIDRHWLDQLNLQPRYRLAAGWGAEIVRKYQNEFMQAAWEQMGDVLAAERAFSLSRFSQDILQAIKTRHLEKLDETRLLSVLGPMRFRVKVAANQSLYGRIGQATFPDEVLGGAMRRFTSPRRATWRQALWRQRGNAQNFVSEVSGLIKTFASAVKNRTAIDPNRFIPDGLLGSRSFAEVPLPRGSDKLVDLKPYTGLSGSLPASQIRAVQKMGVAAEKRSSRVRLAVPPMGDVVRNGLLTEAHEQRLYELQRTAKRPIDKAALISEIRKASTPEADSVLLTLGAGGKVSAQALKVDRTTGVVNPTGRVLPQFAALRANLAGNRFSGLDARALQLHGVGRVINRLPAGAFNVGETPERISLDRVGRFAPFSPAPAAGGGTTVTLPPVNRDPGVLSRYTEAFKSYQKLWKETTEASREAIVPVDFALRDSVVAVQERTRPQRTVPARLASTLAFGGQAAAWDPAQGLRHPFVSLRLDLAVAARLRYVIPPALDRVMAYPRLPIPISRKLQIMAPEVFLPGVGELPDDFIMVLKSNPRFVEALMLGANVEMGRELLWQGFPTDQRGTPFEHFWQRTDGLSDISPIHTWQAAQLGRQPASQEMLVLLVRGQLLERFPNLSIYAWRRHGDEAAPSGPAPGDIEVPILRGHLGTDITYVGFNPRILPPEETAMPHWFFVFEEQMTEPRFGFDEPGAFEDIPGWQGVDWDEVGVLPGASLTSKAFNRVAPGSGWRNPHGGLVASALLQSPFRGFYLGTKLVPPKN